MALTKTPPAIDTPATDAVQAVKPVGTFESMDETTTNKVAANDTATANEPAAQPAAPASTAVVRQQGGAVAVSNRPQASDFQRQVEAMKDNADFTHGKYDTFKGITGEIKGVGDCKATLGRWAKVTMIAWGQRYQVAPGSDSPAATETVAYSKDGVIVDSVIGFEKYGQWVGKKVSDYLDFLHTNDWVDARVNPYIDVACIVHEGESAESRAFIGEPICISLSKSSMGSFGKYQEKLETKAKAIARGGPLAALVQIPEDPFTFYFIREAASAEIKGGKKEWTKLKVSSTLVL